MYDAKVHLSTKVCSYRITSINSYVNATGAFTKRVTFDITLVLK